MSKNKLLPSTYVSEVDSDSIFLPVSTNPTGLESIYQKLLPNKPGQLRWECQYCYESKRTSKFISPGAMPHHCSSHLGTKDNRVCRSCLKSALGEQMDHKSLFEISCPKCAQSWDPEHVKHLISKRDAKKFKSMEAAEKGRTVLLEDEPNVATMDLLIAEGVRCW